MIFVLSFHLFFFPYSILSSISYIIYTFLTPLLSPFVLLFNLSLFSTPPFAPLYTVLNLLYQLRPLCFTSSLYHPFFFLKHLIGIILFYYRLPSLRSQPWNTYLVFSVSSSNSLFIHCYKSLFFLRPFGSRLSSNARDSGNPGETRVGMETKAVLDHLFGQRFYASWTNGFLYVVYIFHLVSIRIPQMFLYIFFLRILSLTYISLRLSIKYFLLFSFVNKISCFPTWFDWPFAILTLNIIVKTCFFLLYSISLSPSCVGCRWLYRISSNSARTCVNTKLFHMKAGTRLGDRNLRWYAQETKHRNGRKFMEARIKATNIHFKWSQRAF